MTMSTATRWLPERLERLAAWLERQQGLDALSRALQPLGERILPEGPIRNVASGTVIGHALHPALVAVPLGSWTAASYLDFTGADAGAARRMIGLGNLAAVPALATGANDWLTTEGAEQRVGLVHAALNWTALTLYTASWVARGRDHRGRGVVYALAGGAVLVASGWLGGHLSYALGVGVDTTAFQHIPTEWTDVAADAEVGERHPVAADAAGVPMLLIRVDGQVRALADRCTHRGGPLHQGVVDDGCVTCPWHASRFDLRDGEVIAGPASRPQPVAEVQVVNGRVQVRRSGEPRALRTNPAGV